MSNEQPPVRKVIPYKSGKRVSTFRKLNIDFAGTALEAALNEQEQQEEKLKPALESLPTDELSDTTIHQSPPVTTTPQPELIKEGRQADIDEITNKKAQLSLQIDAKTAVRGESPPVTTTPQNVAQPSKSSIPPTRDFNRRANSLDRDAMPSGLFPGSTKKVYDALYLRTRGAVVPTKTVRASRRDLLTWTGIRNLKTIDNHIRYLMAKGLIVRHWELGSNEGSSYEVLMPEEVSTQPPLPTSGGDWSPLSTSHQKTSSGYTQKLGSGGEGQIVDNTATYENHKTIKTYDDDDTHTLARFNATLMEAARGIVGGELIDSEQERERWNELAKLLADELKEAASRTGAISSVPAFFTAHLRRKLAQKSSSPAKIKRLDEAPPKTAPTAVSDAEAKKGQKGATLEREALMNGKSKFSLEECRRYAYHLHSTGQGITNPGGFALTIYRSGISDALIEKFLHPAGREANSDASACADCHGTGFYYPQGVERGVVKCRHEGLKKTEAPKRLTPEEITEQAGIICELLANGYTMEQAEAQFAASLNADDWAAIRARLEEKKGV